MINTDSKKIDEILGRGVAEIIEKESLKNKLLSGKQLRIKFGIDPTAPDLHLGHTVVLRKLKQFQDLGHKIIFLIGDFTATIGDPSGRMSQRQQLSKKEIKKNMKDYTKQASKILDIKKTEIRYNSEWYKKKKAIFLMELSSKITYARVIERDDFQ
ncbi:MAG: tyrosine--tRNA ligase, partial [Candidatus Staskawiczbacteria bacterium]|nr:tyrosine--tRNA ligase [Candidatus Staskawiczbacteria bacterium]